MTTFEVWLLAISVLGLLVVAFAADELRLIRKALERLQR